MSNSSFVHFTMNQVSLIKKKKKICKKRVLKYSISDREVGNGESALEMLPMCCLCNSAFTNGPWGCSQVLPPCLCDTHTNTHKDDDDYNDDDDDDERLCCTQSTEPEPVSGQARAGFSRPLRCPELPGNSGLQGTLTRNSGSRGSEAAPPGPGPARLTCDASPGDALHHGLHGGGCGYWDKAVRSDFATPPAVPWPAPSVGNTRKRSGRTHSSELRPAHVGHT